MRCISRLWKRLFIYQFVSTTISQRRKTIFYLHRQIARKEPTRANTHLRMLTPSQPISLHLTYTALGTELRILLLFHTLWISAQVQCQTIFGAWHTSVDEMVSKLYPTYVLLYLQLNAFFEACEGSSWHDARPLATCSACEP